ncbi:YggS family pyridoxal phosphate-dependent enzyme [Myroides odoratimimus]|uniref:YggS family pyridoxal phosphate-dependent enzyme n=1 Tax=Myroides odoratimimus TaxID=76832 RepID=UPI0025750931|nr:YggS family pyridoxal phosphate-dependent enzyme [Myroides odoratimimus]MDM1396116.1 YggS family pyridoxal phosphate-dependent enzyme [Myroides odoratimimus]
MKTRIKDNLASIEKRITAACVHSGRSRDEVQLLLATKTVDADRIKMAIEEGYPLIGENKVQELRDKYEGIGTDNCTRHFIGHLQTNKIKDILKYGVTCIESIDRISVVEKLQQLLERDDRTIDVLIQVNTSDEDSKFGVAPEAAIDFIKEVATYDRLHIKGLMTIGLFSAEESLVRPCFKILKKVQQETIALQLPNVEMKELSMGMSHDLEIAIEEGATIVRVGTAIFGERIYPDSYYWNEEKSIK